MSRRKRSKQTGKPGSPLRGRRIVILVTPALVILAIVALFLFGRGTLALCARQMAAREMKVGAISAAQQWLAWSGWFDSGDGNTELMQAACFRHLKQVDHYVNALESAKRKGAPATRIQQEMRLGLIEAGKLEEGAENQIGALIEAGLSPHEVARAYVCGFLVRDEPEEAKKVLDAWAADCPEEASVAYIRGVYWQWLNEPARAETEFQVALARQPRHELAGTALAELLEGQDRLEEALQQYVESATRFPASRTAQLGVARVLRKTGRIDEARAVLESLASRPEASSDVALEMAQVELESGNYRETDRWFKQADLDETEDQDVLYAAATTFALAEEATRAERLFARADADYGRRRRIDDLQVRLTIDPHDRSAGGELERLSRPSSTASANVAVPRTEQAGDDQRRSRATSASDLYALHCSVCHGARGDGNGHAARHLLPRPRDLRTDKSRLVSTLNGVPTLEDLEAVITRGMPDTSMQPFDNLSDEQRNLLAEEVLRLNREGIRERFVAALRSEGEEIDEDEVRQVVEFCTTPGEAVPVPQIGAGDSEAIARGKDTYFRLGCDNCHGDDGVGAWDTPLFDEKGRPSPPRDLAHEPFKGGEEPESIYLRIFVGMPGTPHPGCWNVPADQLVDLVQYCRALSGEPKRALTNHERGIRAARRAYVAAFGGPPTP